MLIEHCSSHLN
jgi:hypothetical protein